jgi:hypothetical protein
MIRTAVVAIALTVLCAGAQDLRRTSFRVNVTDKYGRSIGGLKPENFRVRVNDAETKVVAANIDEAPASVTILIDISDSITKRRRQWAITSAWKLISVANRNNEYSIIAFGKTVYPIAGWETPRDKIKSKLEELGNLKIGGGNTGLYDGVIAGIEKANSGNFGRKVLVVYSDGVDTASEAEWSNIKSKVRRSDLTVFASRRLIRRNADILRIRSAWRFSMRSRPLEADAPSVRTRTPSRSKSDCVSPTT